MGTTLTKAGPKTTPGALTFHFLYDLSLPFLSSIPRGRQNVFKMKSNVSAFHPLASKKNLKTTHLNKHRRKHEIIYVQTNASQ